MTHNTHTHTQYVTHVDTVPSSPSPLSSRDANSGFTGDAGVVGTYSRWLRVREDPRDIAATGIPRERVRRRRGARAHGDNQQARRLTDALHVTPREIHNARRFQADRAAAFVASLYARVPRCEPGSVQVNGESHDG